MILLGSFLMLFVGFTLGLLGGGGSILTVPILTYVFALNPVVATASSLFIVGMTSAFGSFKKFKLGEVDFKIALTFAVPGFAGVFLSRAFVIPFLPNEILSMNGFVLFKENLIMLVFSIIMLMASISMIRGRKEPKEQESEKKISHLVFMTLGFLVGLLSGFVGAGGGFLIIPALVHFAHLKVKKAMGTSLLVITINSLFGFLGEVFVNSNIDWLFLFKLTFLSIIGIYVGSAVSKKVSDKSLKKMFGYFVLMMGIFILYKQF